MPNISCRTTNYTFFHILAYLQTPDEISHKRTDKGLQLIITGNKHYIVHHIFIKKYSYFICLVVTLPLQCCFNVAILGEVHYDTATYTSLLQ